MLDIIKIFVEETESALKSFFKNNPFAFLRSIKYDLIRGYFIVDAACEYEPFSIDEINQCTLKYLVEQDFAVDVCLETNTYRIINSKQNKSKIKEILETKEALNINYFEETCSISHFCFILLPESANKLIENKINLDEVNSISERLSLSVQKAVYSHFNFETYTFDCFKKSGESPVYSLWASWMFDPSANSWLENECSAAKIELPVKKSSSEFKNIYECLLDEDWIYALSSKANEEKIVSIAKALNFEVLDISKSNPLNQEPSTITEIQLKILQPYNII